MRFVGREYKLKGFHEIFASSRFEQVTTFLHTVSWDLLRISCLLEKGIRSGRYGLSKMDFSCFISNTYIPIGR
jgi:hypothetical protein